nr:hypothetical protein [Acidisarcina polymorpha]
MKASASCVYLIKPFALPELLARIRALYRRVSPDTPSRIVLDDLSIASMLEEVARLTTMIDTLRTISHAGEVTLTRSRFSAMELVQEAIAIVKVLAEDKAQTILMAESSDCELLADRLFLRMAVVNSLDMPSSIRLVAARSACPYASLTGSSVVDNVWRLAWPIRGQEFLLSRRTASLIASIASTDLATGRLEDWV